MCPFGMYAIRETKHACLLRKISLDRPIHTTSFSLYSFAAQKAWIALEVSGATFELTEIGLYGANGKPDWFWELNPKGTVPVLDCGDEAVWTDSDLILDRLPQMPGGEVLQPSSLEIETKVKEWRREINHMLPIAKKAIQGGGQKPLIDILRRLDGMVQGPYLCGSQVTVADCAAFPFVWRLDTELDMECPNLHQWLKHCQDSNPAFRKTVQSAWWWWW